MAIIDLAQKPDTAHGRDIAFAVGIVFMLAILFLPAAQDQAGFLTGLGFQGAQWLWPLLIPPVAAAVAYAATQRAALRVLGALT